MIQIAVEETSRIGARIFAGAQKTLLSTNTQLVLPCWVSSTGWPPFSVVTPALWQAVTAKQNSAAAMNSFLGFVVVIWVLLEAYRVGITVRRRGRSSSGTLARCGRVKFTP